MTKLEQILNKLGLLDEISTSTQANPVNTVPADNAQVVADAVAAERKRISDLQAFDCKDNMAAAAIIDAAVKNGQTINDVKIYLDAVQNMPFNGVQNLVNNMIKDNQESGVEDVKGNPQNEAEEEKAADAQAMNGFVAAMNKFGGKK